jgi:hypothetical protein
MARSSEGHAFAFGEYTSMDALFNYLLKSAYTVTTSSRFCPNGHDVDRRESRVSSCNITLSRRGCNLQEYLDDFTSISSAKCPVCSKNLTRRFTFNCHPPIFTIDLGEGAFPQETLELTSQNVRRRYNLRGVIYYAADHFTTRFITNAGAVWYHDGLLTGRSLVYESMVPSQIPHEDAIVGIYMRSP